MPAPLFLKKLLMVEIETFWIGLGVIVAIFIPVVGFVNKIHNRSMTNKSDIESNKKEVNRICSDFKDHERLNERAITKIEEIQRSDFNSVITKIEELKNIILNKLN